MVIPLFNKRQSILRAVDSVLAQSYEDFELIVVDDGSTDGGADLIRGLNNTRIRIIVQENQGVSCARNNGVANADSDWIAFLDADDEYLPDFLKETTALIKKYPDDFLAFVGSDYDSGNTTKKVVATQTGIYDYYSLFRNQRSPVCSSSVLVNKCSFEKVGGYDPALAQFEDWLLYFKLANVGLFGYVVNKLAVYHTDYQTGSTVQDYDKLYDGALYLIVASSKNEECKITSDGTKPSYQQAMNGFIVSLALLLSKAGEKKKALGMLKELKSFNFGWRPELFKKIWSLAVYMIFPAWLLNTVKKFKRASRS